MILEGLLLTRNPSGELNLAPMGPLIETADQTTGVETPPEIRRFTFRPYHPSTTLANLLAVPEATFHTTDDVLLIARAALKDDLPEPFVLPELVAVDSSLGNLRLADCCQWWDLEVASLDDARPRATLQMKVVRQGHERPFLGFNRARHAVLEAVILATRTSLLDPEVIRQQVKAWQPLVEKTAGERERLAWELVTRIIEQRLAGRVQDSSKGG